MPKTLYFYLVVDYAWLESSILKARLLASLVLQKFEALWRKKMSSVTNCFEHICCHPICYISLGMGIFIMLKEHS